MRRTGGGTGVIAVDVFFAAFAVMFALDSITESAPPTMRGGEYSAGVAVPWPAGAPGKCLVLLEIYDVGGNLQSNLSGDPDVEIEGEMCVTKFGEPIQLDGNADVHARFMLLRHVSDSVTGEIRLGSRVIRDIQITTSLGECGAPPNTCP